MPLSPTDQIFCKALIALFQYQKQIGEMAFSTVQELRALRETVKGLDPTFVEVLAERQNAVAKAVRQKEQELGIPAIAAMQESIDQILQLLRQLENGEIG